MKNYIHLAQSQYAKNFLKTKGLKSFLIEDYINEDFLKSAIDIDLSLKKPVITYNPSKGKKYMDLFKKLFPEINMIPLVGMTRDEMIKCLKESMVYLDLGQHPGRDRIPREAAVQGCVVMTSKFGSAENSLDVAIDEFYKTRELTGMDQFSKNLNRISNRGFTDASLISPAGEDSISNQWNGYSKSLEFIGVVKKNYKTKTLLETKQPFSTQDTLYLMRPDKAELTQLSVHIESLKGVSLSQVGPNQHVWLHCPAPMYGVLVR